MNILFLDIDGVLNSKNTGTYYSLNTSEKYSIEETCWSNLEKILKKVPDLKVVIHSGWIKYKDDPNCSWDMNHPEMGITVKTLLPKVIEKLGKRYIGCVDYIKGKPKSYRIEKWLKDHDALDNYDWKVVVVDDDKSKYTNLEGLKKFVNVDVVFTDSNIGLDVKTLDQIVRYFK